MKKKEIWQDALNEVDEKFAGEYAKILEKDAEREVPLSSPQDSAPSAGQKRRQAPKWTGWALIAACLSLVLITAAATGAFKRDKVSEPTTTLATGQDPDESAIYAGGIISGSGGSDGADNTENTTAATGPATTAPTTSAPSSSAPAVEGSQSANEMEAPISAPGNVADGASYLPPSYSYRKQGQAYSGNPLYGNGGNPFPDGPFNTEEYAYIEENSFLSVKTSPFATFAADVDTAFYTNLRRMIRQGWDIPAESVRIEEMINYFRYDYAEPREGEPFGVTLELADCPWNSHAKLLLIGLQAKKLEAEALPPSNLVFLIDVSGSMATPDKLPLVQRSFMTLAENLSADDRVTIITYSSGEKLVADGISGAETARIMGALEELQAGGATNGQQALKMAYEAARRHYIPGGNNRIILATDGDFNVGITSEAELTAFVKEQAAGGVFLSVLGYGMGNYKDNKMEAMADNGNGNYYYIDDIAEARKVLIDEAGGTLFTVAKDVKLQVEFNPAQVKGYRLIGYENRVMAAEDFADDTKDGGELGAGHQVTALFEIIPADSDFEIPEVDSRYGQDGDPSHITADEWLVLNIRYKEPEGDESKLLSYPLALDALRPSMSDNLSWAAGVAQWGMLLRDSEYKGSTTYASLLERLEGLKSLDGFRQECLELIKATARDD